jgi:hypothetical protein
MGGDEAVSGNLYKWYWGDTKGMYHELLSYGFTGDNIYFLAYDDSAEAHPGWVDAVSTTANIESAYQWAANNCTDDDLLYIYWVDHGKPTYFYTHDGTITHARLGTIMQPIDARQIIGAYNPCYSGGVIDDISASGVITVTSQDAGHVNNWGWAGKWRQALRNQAVDNVDTDHNGYVSMTEAFNWIAPQSQAAGEHSMFDDNGDGKGHEWGQAGYDPNNHLKDGYNGKYYFLDGWLCKPKTRGAPDPAHIYYKFAFDPIWLTLYVGQFDGPYTASDVITLEVNGYPATILGVTSHPDFYGEVVEASFEAAPFLDDYGAPLDTVSEYFFVSGTFSDATPFEIEDRIGLVGKSSASGGTRWIVPPDEVLLHGDADLSGEIDIDDVVAIINIIFGGGDVFGPLLIADCDCSHSVDVDDVVYLVQYIFNSGPFPCHD